MSIFLFFHSLFASWLVWAGGTLRLIPFIETLVEPWLRAKHPKIDSWFAQHEGLKKDLKAIALVCVLIACYRAWVFEHNNAQNAMYGKDGKSEAWAKYNQCDKQLGIKSILADTYSQQVLEQNSRLAAQQQTFNQCVLTLANTNKPERLVTEAYFIGGLYNEMLGAKDRVGSWIVATNRSITPVRLLVRCDGIITEAGARVLGTGIMTGGGWGGRFSDHKYGIGINSPAWTSLTPLLVTIHSPNADLGNCEFTEQ